MSLTSSPRPGDAGRRRVGRPAALDPDAVADAVLAVGFPELTFAAVAERLGVGQATLYRHAAHRDELVRLGVDLALRRIVWPDLDGPWRPLLERWALASWHAWEQHPGAVAEVTRGIAPPSMLVLADRVGAALVDRGFTARDAVLAVDLVFDLAADNRRGIEAFDTAAPGQQPVRAAMEQQWRVRPATAAAAADPAVAEQQVRAEMVRAIQAEPLAWFRSKLRVVLTGIERELAPRTTDQEDA